MVARVWCVSVSRLPSVAFHLSCHMRFTCQSMADPSHFFTPPGLSSAIHSKCALQSMPTAIYFCLHLLLPACKVGSLECTQHGLELGLLNL